MVDAKFWVGNSDCWDLVDWGLTLTGIWVGGRSVWWVRVVRVFRTLKLFFLGFGGFEVVLSCGAGGSLGGAWGEGVGWSETVSK